MRTVCPPKTGWRPSPRKTVERAHGERVASVEAHGTQTQQNTEPEEARKGIPKTEGYPFGRFSLSTKDDNTAPSSRACAHVATGARKPESSESYSFKSGLCARCNNAAPLWATWPTYLQVGPVRTLQLDIFAANAVEATPSSRACAHVATSMAQYPTYNDLILQVGPVRTLQLPRRLRFPPGLNTLQVGPVRTLQRQFRTRFPTHARITMCIS